MGQLISWLMEHPEMEVSLKWADFIGQYKIKLSMHDRHICFVVPYPLVEEQLPFVLDELLYRLGDIPRWQLQGSESEKGVSE